MVHVIVAPRRKSFTTANDTKTGGRRAHSDLNLLRNYYSLLCIIIAIIYCTIHGAVRGT